MRLTLALLALIIAATNASAASAPLGRWLTASGNVVVEIAPCGSKLCGKVVEVRGNVSMEDSRKRIASPPRLGMTILSDLEPYGDAEWKGHIFNRENGKTYDCLITLEDTNSLRVRPYIFISLIGQTQRWKRV